MLLVARLSVKLAAVRRGARVIGGTHFHEDTNNIDLRWDNCIPKSSRTSFTERPVSGLTEIEAL